MPSIASFLDQLRTDPGYRGQIAHVHRMPARSARYDALESPLPPPLAETLADSGIDRLYTHQAEAIRRAREWQHLVVVTSTASGKTLCYLLPILEDLLAIPAGRSLLLFPTKALAQDQAKAIHRASDANLLLAPKVRAGVYDGDTPQGARRK